MKKRKGKITINGETLSIDKINFEKLSKKMSVSVAEKIEKITIKSSFGNVNIISSTGDKMEAHLYSEGTFAGNVSLDIQQIDNELIITAEFSGICNGGVLQLEVLVPEEKYLKSISINPINS